MENNNLLPLMEEFCSIQGEGYHAGKPAYFIRIAGCDIGCHWCDTKDSWNADEYPLVPVDNIVENAVLNTPKIAIITGGEPLMYPLDYLTGQLINKGFMTHLETSGAYPLTGKWHWICLSPKKNKPPRGEIYEKANELKIIIFNNDDLKWAEEQSLYVHNNCKLYLQAEWNNAKKMMPHIVNYVKNNPKWGVSLQVHKYMEIQ